MYYDRTWTNMGSTYWKHMTTTSPNKTSSNAAQCSAKKLEKDNKRKATDENSLRRECKYTKLQDTPAVRRAYNRHDGGITPDDCGEDISQETLELLMSSFYETKVVTTSEQAHSKPETRQLAMSGKVKEKRGLQLQRLEEYVK